MKLTWYHHYYNYWGFLFVLMKWFQIVHVLCYFDNANDKITANYVELTKLPINAILGALHMPKKFG